MIWGFSIDQHRMTLKHCANKWFVNYNMICLSIPEHLYLISLRNAWYQKIIEWNKNDNFHLSEIEAIVLVRTWHGPIFVCDGWISILSWDTFIKRHDYLKQLLCCLSMLRIFLISLRNDCPRWQEWLGFILREKRLDTCSSSSKITPEVFLNLWCV